jgi:serpin B
MKAPIFLLAVFLTSLSGPAGRAGTVAVNAINALGIDLLQHTASSQANALLSPYSIQIAMGMTCAGADGKTRDEMVRVLHYPADEGQVDESFAALQADLKGMMQRQAANSERLQKYGIVRDPLTLTTANRLFGQQGYDFRPVYLTLLKDTYGSPFEPLDFFKDPSGAGTHINDWVAGETHDRIQNLIPPGALTKETRLVLVNAIYLKAPWQSKFPEEATQPRPFHLPGGTVAQVPTMFLDHSLGYARGDGCQRVVIPYADGELQFVIILPDATDGLAALEANLKPETLADGADLPFQEIKLFLPKFKLEPPTLSLSDTFKALGMKTAFDVPPQSANFDRMAPRRPDDYLYISDIYHKTFLKLDETGTEAAAATAVAMAMAAAVMMSPPPPIEVHVDHPFLFAIQHRASGACLFLGHVADPR